MAKTSMIEESKKQITKPKTTEQDRNNSVETPFATLQNHLGNRAIQRLLAQRSSGDGAFDLDEATASRINGARGGGQALDSAIQTKMGESMGADFSGVRVHTGGESHTFNEHLNAKAFTAG